ncbi:MAG: right-handed parallel beta-helix repeat-containing protein [bacterium]
MQMRSHLRRTPSLRLALTALASSVGFATANADVQILGAAGTNYSTIQAAVDAASDGDTLLLAGETYAGFVIDAKGLTLIALPGVTHEIQGQIVVRNLPATSWVRLDGLVVRGRPFIGSTENETALRLDLNAGAVHLHGCDVLGGSGPDDFYNSGYADGGHGVHVSDCAQVAFLDCDLQGGNGAGVIGSFKGLGGTGGRGVWAQNTAAAVYDSRCIGGAGGTAGTTGGRGGDGYRAEGVGLFASGSHFEGGDGGDADDFIAFKGGDGGTGIWVELTTMARLLENTYVAGEGGFSLVGPDGDPGLPTFWEGGPLGEEQGSRRSLTVSESLVADGDSFQLRVEGLPGDKVFLAKGVVPDFVFSAGPSSVRLVRFPQYLLWGSGVVIGPSGVLDFAVPTHELVGGAWRSFAAQALILPAGGGRAIGGAVFLTALDDEVGPDCNNNGRRDLFDLIAGIEADCNGDFSPDSCGVTTDCNSNGVDDAIDIECGVSGDVNGNGLLDECEVGVTLHVDAGAAPGGDGSAGAPLDNLADAFSLALDDWRIEVAGGVYSGAQNRELDFAGRDLEVYCPAGSGACTIDLQQSGRAFSALGGSPSIELRGFTISNGFTSLGGPGGLWVGNNASALVEDCMFENCSADGGGGALRSDGDTVMIDCVFENNSAIENGGNSYGGAIHAFGSLQASDTRFSGNSATVGGAIFYQGSSGNNVFAHCIFRSNSAVTAGGAIAQFNGTMRVDNSFFESNSATGGAGGATWTGSTTGGSSNFMYLRSSTLVDNHASQGTGDLEGGGACFVAASGYLLLRNSILWDNTAAVGPAIKGFGSSGWQPGVDVDFCDVEGGSAGIVLVNGNLFAGATVLDIDPIFVNRVASDYRLGNGSPCIDAGDDTELENDRLDIDGDGNTNEAVPLDLIGNPRETDDPLAPDGGVGATPICDMGALERLP